MKDIKEIAPLPPPYGGVSVYLKRLVERLKSDGYSVGGYYSAQSTPNNEDGDFQKWRWLETRKFPLKVFRFLRQIAPFRIVHSHLSFESMAYLWAARHLSGKRVVITVHHAMAGSYFIQTHWINRFFIRKMARVPDVVWIAVSEQARQRLLEQPIKFCREILVIPAFIPSVASDSSLLPAFMLSYIEAHPRNLAFYGHSFMSHNGQDVYGFERMLEAYSAICQLSGNNPGLVFCIADVSEETSVRSLMEKAEKLGIKEAVYWQMGPLPSLEPLWERIDVYVRPTCTDGDSVAVREALSAGCQVVASDVCRRPDGCLLYDPDSLCALSDAIDKALRKERNPECKDETFYLQMKAVYDSLLNTQS